MGLREDIILIFEKIDIQKGLGISPEKAADCITNLAPTQLYSDSIQKFIDDRVAALEMLAQRERPIGRSQDIRTIEIHQAIEPTIRASGYAQRSRP